MGLPVIRKLVDLTCGHCFYPVVFAQGSPNVFVNGMPVVRQGDFIKIHCCGKVCHIGAAVGNKSRVYANNRAIQVRTNPVTCGDHSCNGSPNVFCNP